LASAVLLLAVVFASEQPVHALTISPTFDSAIADNPDGALIEGAINTAIGTIDSLYGNAVNLPVTFAYRPQAPGTLSLTNQLFYHVPFSTYVGLLQNASAADPANAFLATALANLPSGNAVNASVMSITGAQLTMLHAVAGLPGNTPGGATISLNSNANFAFTGPVPPDRYDAVGDVEHELDEVLGGGGGGSTLNRCITNPGFYCGTYGPTDLYRYSAPGVPGYTASSAATSYFSIDGGNTAIASFNQDPAGDLGDFAPPCGTGGGADELIQDAFSCPGPYEAYTTSSPEYAMVEAIGWDSVAVPEPDTLALLGFSLVGLGFVSRRRD